MIDYCKYCKSEDVRLVENYEYKFEEEDLEFIEANICNNCGCVHKIVDNEVEFFEFSTKDLIEHNTSGNWKI